VSGDHGAEKLQKRTLLIVLVLNFSLFVALGVGGVLADSSALLANALDNASDAAVYLISFLAVGRALIWKTRAAGVSGVMLLIFAGVILVDVVRRMIVGAEPMGWTMMGLAVVAAVVNLICLELIRRQKSDDVNMKAAETFSFNPDRRRLGDVAGPVLARSGRRTHRGGDRGEGRSGYSSGRPPRRRREHRDDLVSDRRSSSRKSDRGCEISSLGWRAPGSDRPVGRAVSRSRAP